ALPTELPGRVEVHRTSAVLTGFEPAASALTGRRALQTAPQDLGSCWWYPWPSPTHGGAPRGVRIPVTALKGRRPRPLDDGGSLPWRGAHRSSGPSRRSRANLVAFRVRTRSNDLGRITAKGAGRAPLGRAGSDRRRGVARALRSRAGAAAPTAPDRHRGRLRRLARRRV